MDTMRLSSEDDEDDYYLDDDFEDEAPKKGLFSKRNNTEPEDEPEGQEKPKFLGRSNPKVVPMRRSMEVTMIKPTSMDDSRDICDYLLSGKAVVLNISNYIFIATPDSVELSGDFQDILSAGVSSGVDMSSLNIHL